MQPLAHLYSAIAVSWRLPALMPREIVAALRAISPGHHSMGAVEFR
jgi:hypothetical protein